MKKSNNQIGIMIGRLSKPVGQQIQAFPIKSWRDEFENASKCGFELIEWIYDLYGKNPIMNDDGVKEMKYLARKHNLEINAVCADYFMTKKIFGVSNSDSEKNLSVLKKLIRQCQALNIDILEIPLVDSSSIKNKINEEQLVSNLEKILPTAQDNNVRLTLETNLPPILFKELLSRFNHPNIMANYDIGNSTSLGFDPKIELETLEPWIINIHIKDRVRNGTTVPLGTGDVDFNSFFRSLRKIHYKMDLIIQGAREDLDNPEIKPEVTCKKYLKFVRQYVDKYLSRS
ncbi:MAG: sugar phosphate isomerase/epimerase family protein [Nitrosotalea sp.]